MCFYPSIATVQPTLLIFTFTPELILSTLGISCIESTPSNCSQQIYNCTGSLIVQQPICVSSSVLTFVVSFNSTTDSLGFGWQYYAGSLVNSQTCPNDGTGNIYVFTPPESLGTAWEIRKGSFYGVYTPDGAINTFVDMFSWTFDKQIGCCTIIDGTQF